jgi:hypothetical protein
MSTRMRSHRFGFGFLGGSHRFLGSSGRLYRAGWRRGDSKNATLHREFDENGSGLKMKVPRRILGGAAGISVVLLSSHRGSFPESKGLRAR